MKSLLHFVAHATVFARLRVVVLVRVQLNVLDRVTQRAAASVTHRNATLELHNGHLGDPQLGIATMAVPVLHHRRM